MSERIKGLLDEGNGTRQMARDAIHLCWPWVSEKSVDTDRIVVFIHGPDEDDLLVRLAELPVGPASWALAAIEAAVCYVLHHAMDEQGARSRPEPIWEVNEETLDEVLGLALKSGGLVQAHLERWIDLLEGVSSPPRLADFAEAVREPMIA